MTSKEERTRYREALLDAGEERFYDGDYDGSLAKFAEAVELDRDDPEAHYLLARSLFYLGRDEEAESSYDRALDLVPDFAPALIHKAELFVRALGWSEEALDLLAEAEALSLHRDDQIEACFVRGLALMEQGEYRLALEPLNRAIRGDADWAEALRERGICRFYLWRFADTVRDLERAIAADPGDAESHYFLAMCYERLGQASEALRAYQRASALDPQSLQVPYRSSREDFQRAASEAIDDLPDAFRVRFDNIQFSIEDLPQKEMGVLPDVYGWCAIDATGESTLHRLLQPCRVLLFQKNLERIAPDLSSLKDEIGRTVLQEIGNYFGLHEDEVTRVSIH